VKEVAAIREAVRIRDPRVRNWVLVTILFATAVTVIGKSTARGSAGSESYEISGVEFTVPEAGSIATQDIDGPAALVEFDVQWPASGYPGRAQCSAVLEDAFGALVGSLEFELVVGKPGVRPSMAVPLSGVPVSADVSCRDVAVGVPGAGYIFGSPTKIAPANIWGDREEEAVQPRSEITFDVRLEHEGTDPDFRTCFLVVKHSDGTVDDAVQYDILGGAGPMTFDVPGSAESIADAEMRCGPLVES
jgi:hypothetical protein